MDKEYTLKEKELRSLLDVQEELVKSRELMHYGELKLDKYRGANYFLNSAINKYNNLDKELKDLLHIDVNIGELEKLAVNILVNQGHSKLVNKALLKKYGLYCGEKGK